MILNGPKSDTAKSDFELMEQKVILIRANSDSESAKVILGQQK